MGAKTVAYIRRADWQRITAEVGAMVEAIPAAHRRKRAHTADYETRKRLAGCVEHGAIDTGACRSAVYSEPVNLGTAAWSDWCHDHYTIRADEVGRKQNIIYIIEEA